ncbi:MAG: hypothetical protein BGO34_03605 [Bacteroidia bacterium 44-10]|nr:MAG: hypothetical protein BGO34_03605 [Bacteroidia bacterium 44-10]
MRLASGIARSLCPSQTEQRSAFTNEWGVGFGLSGGEVKKTRKEAGEAESCLSEASSFREAESMVFSPRRVSLDFFDSFLSRKKNILMIV